MTRDVVETGSLEDYLQDEPRTFLRLEGRGKESSCRKQFRDKSLVTEGCPGIGKEEYFKYRRGSVLQTTFRASPMKLWANV